jgi:hypothetical protein
MPVELLPEADFRILACLRANAYQRRACSCQSQMVPKAALARIVRGDRDIMGKDSPKIESAKPRVAVSPQAYSMNTRATVHFGTGSYVSLLRAD